MRSRKRHIWKIETEKERKRAKKRSREERKGEKWNGVPSWVSVSAFATTIPRISFQPQHYEPPSLFSITLSVSNFFFFLAIEVKMDGRFRVFPVFAIHLVWYVKYLIENHIIINVMNIIFFFTSRVCEELIHNIILYLWIWIKFQSLIAKRKRERKRRGRNRKKICAKFPSNRSSFKVPRSRNTDRHYPYISNPRRNASLVLVCPRLDC